MRRACRHPTAMLFTPFVPLHMPQIHCSHLPPTQRPPSKLCPQKPETSPDPMQKGHFPNPTIPSLPTVRTQPPRRNDPKPFYHDSHCLSPRHARPSSHDTPDDSCNHGCTAVETVRANTCRSPPATTMAQPSPVLSLGRSRNPNFGLTGIAPAILAEGHRPGLAMPCPCLTARPILASRAHPISDKTSSRDSQPAAARRI
jgi:hypothetical protein